MGNLCSKASTHSGGHTLAGPARAAQSSYGSTAGRPAGEDARSAAAAAAENRLKAAQARGTNKANPKQGQLSANLEAAKSKPTNQEQEPERLVWD